MSGGRLALLRRFGGVLAGLLVALLVSGCAVTTTVAVRVDPAGDGTVTVTVALDRAAAALSGDLATSFDLAGLAAAGWSVTGPTTAAGVTTLTARHRFTAVSQLPAVLSGVAASGDRPLFSLEVSNSHSLFREHVTLHGTVDLRCGVDCFGDAGLQQSFGSPVGVSAAGLEQQYHETPAQALRFDVQVHLPGKVTATDATSRAGAVLGWTPRLGDAVALTATTTTVDQAHLTDARYAAAALGAALLALLVVAAVHWRRRRRAARPRPAHARR